MLPHPLLSLGFEPLKSSIAHLGFALPKTPAFTKEPQSNREVVQPTNEAAVNQALATEAMPEFRERLLQAIAPVPGARLAKVRSVKNPRSLEEKTTQTGRAPDTISDYGAVQIAVTSPQARAAVVEALKRNFTILKERNNFELGDPEFRFRCHSIQVQMPNGASAELQILPEEIFEANRAEHSAYKRARHAEVAGKSSAHAKAEARSINDESMKRFHSRNALIARSRIQKGSRVKLVDGTLARVEYADPNMSIARVRTADGRNITVRNKDLREIL